MKKSICHENYPCGYIFLCNMLQLAIYIIGVLIMSLVGWFPLSVYLLYLILLEIKLLRYSCTRCYYYGKYCAFGRGKLSSLMFKKDNSGRFAEDELTWKDIVPDFLVSVVPIIVGIILLILRFDLILLILIIVLFLLTFIGNGLVRGSLACKFCKQRELGCPAEKLFNKRKR